MTMFELTIFSVFFFFSAAAGGLIAILFILLSVIITVTVVAAVTVMGLRWRQRQTRDRFVLNKRDVQ